MSLDELTAEGAQIVSRCEVWIDGQPVDDPKIAGGSVTYDATARVARTCEVSLLGEIPAGPGDPLAPIGSELRLFRGARDWTGEIFEEALGRYAFDGSAVARHDRLVEISGGDYASLVSEARWEAPYVIPGGANLATSVAAAIETRLSPSLWQAPNLETTTATVPPTVWGEEVDNDPMVDVRSLARSDGLDVGFDREGRLTVATIADPDESPARWIYRAGESPTYLTGSKELTGRPYNVVVARGETVDDVPPVTAIAEDANPQSASYVGRYRRPYFLASAYIETVVQAERAARGELNRLVGLGEIVTMRVVPHPGLDVWQILEAYDPELRVDARYVIDRVELPLLPGEATIVTRRRRI